MLAKTKMSYNSVHSQHRLAWTVKEGLTRYSRSSLLRDRAEQMQKIRWTFCSEEPAAALARNHKNIKKDEGLTRYSRSSLLRDHYCK